MLIPKTSDFRPAHKEQANFYHPHNQINFIPRLKSSPHSEIKSILTIQRPSQLPSLIQKTSNFRPAHKNKVNLDPSTKNGPHTNIKSVYIPTQSQVNFDPNTEVKPISIPTLKTKQFCMPPTRKPS